MAEMSTVCRRSECAFRARLFVHGFLRAVVFVITTLGMMASIACSEGNERPRVVLYVSADDYLARQVIRRFEEQTGIRVDMVGDSEINKTTGLVNRLRAEADNPQADVFWSSECFMMIRLADEKVLAPHESDLARDWPARYTGRDHLWHGFARRARVIVFAPDRVAEDEIPSRWIDLIDPRWKGRIVMADPRFGTTRGHMGAMKLYWSRGGSDVSFDRFLEGLAANDVRVLTSGNAGVLRAVAGGEVDLGLTDTDDVWAAQRNGAHVDLVYPYHGEVGRAGEGTLLIPNTVARIRGGPNPKDAAALIDFLLSEEVERMLVESDSHNIPVRPEIAREFSRYRVPDPLAIDLPEVAHAMDAAVDEAMRVLVK